MKVFLHTLGCRLNEAEVQKWYRQYQSVGFSVVTNIDEADICVVNSCAVTNEAVNKSKKQIRRFKRQKPNLHLVLSGCFPSVEKKQAENMPEIDQVISNSDKDRLVDLTLKHLQIFPKNNSLSIRESKTQSLRRSRAFIKVQDGCRNRCSFCIVTIARGEEKSRSIAEIVDDINELHGKGFKEIVLTGVHLGGYGSDLGSNLSELVNAVLTHTEIERIRFGSLEPWDIPESFFSLFANERLMPHLHLPLQSGSDRILKKMSRRCMSSEYLNLVHNARNHIPNLNITTDLIVGFPGESEDCFGESKDLVNKIGFSHIHVFPYSPRQGTRASTFSDAIPENLKKDRVQEILRINKKLKVTAAKKMVGLREKILIENKKLFFNEQIFRTGYTKNFFKVLNSDNPKIESNQIIDCKIIGTEFINDEIFLVSTF